MRKRGLRLGVASISIALLMAACGSDDESTDTGGGGPEDQAITISDFTFDPDTLTLPSGEEVSIEVTNNDDVEHSFTLDDDSVSQDVEGGESQTVTVNLTEGIGWHCEYHPDKMKGTITIS